MKKIIDGKVYNTETAEEVARYANGRSYSDFHYLDETLYRTKKGAWFIHGCGGAMTGWAESCGDNSYTSGNGIVVLTEEEALAWCETSGVDPDIIEKNFKVEEA